MSRQALALLVAVLIGTCALYAPPAPSTEATAPLYEQAVEIICKYDWDCGLMVDIVGRESGYDPTAVNRDCSPVLHPGMYACWGWFQHILPAGVDGSWLFDPVANTDLAYAKYLNGGLAHWRATR